jgi:hypothetical protein
LKRFLVLLVLLAITAGLAISDWSEPEPEFVYARVQLSNRGGWWNIWNDAEHGLDNPPWHHDYPFADELFVGLIHELTGVHVSPKSYKIVKLESDEVFNYPFLYLSEPGFLDLNPKEIANLGEYIRRGGFIVADDFRGAGYISNGAGAYSNVNELEVLRHYLKLAVPERQLVRLDVTNPIFHSFYDVDTLKMDAPYDIRDYRTPRPYQRLLPEFWGMLDEHGQLQLVANYNNDLGDFWKYLDKGDQPLKESTRSIRIGIDYVIYALTH